MDINHKGPLSETVLDEIALEGLEGITLEALWKRLSVTLELPLPLKESFQKCVWMFILKSCSKLKFYELPVPRKTLKYYERIKHYSDAFDQQNENGESSYIIYKWNPIEKDGIRGSCEFYNERNEISLDELKNLNIKDIEERWDNKFVIVANQTLREKSLFPSYLEKPDISTLHYCMLELIGRGRYNGELSSGKVSLLTYIKDTALVFYLRNLLTEKKLVRKQTVKEAVNGRLTILNILHLSRFYVEVKPKNLHLFQFIFEQLKDKPHHTMSLTDLRKVIPYEFQKLFKRSIQCNIFKKYFIYEKMPYRKIYPNAPENEWKLKKYNNEKEIIGIRLINFNFDLEDIKENKEEDIVRKDDDQGYLDMKNRYVDMPIFDQIFRAIEKFGTEGCSQPELQTYLGMNRYEMRKNLKDMCRSKIISTYMSERGKQRTWIYVTNLNARKSAEKAFVPSMGDFLETLKNNSEKSEVNETEIIKMEVRSQNNSEEINENSQTCKEKLNKDNKNETEITIKQKPLPPSSSQYSKTVSKVEKVMTCLDVINSTIIETGNNDSKQKTIVNNDNNEKIEDLPSMNIKIVQIERNSKVDPKAPITQRQIQRTNLVVNTVNENQIIDSVRMHRIIKDHEKDIGYQDQCCKKSLIRSINWLATNKVIKFFEVIYQLKEYARAEKFLCHNNVTTDMLLANDEVKRIGNAFYITVSEKYFNTKLMKDMKNDDCLKQHSHQKQKKIKYKRGAKFIRTRHLHEFLFYLIYEQNKSSKPIELNDDILNNWSKYYPNLNVTEIKDSLPDLYSNNIDFKMFIMPLPVYENKSNGWANMEDIWARLPLSIAGQMFRIEEEMNKSDELQKYLTHPILQLIPISLLPINVHGALGSSKLFNFHSYEDTLRILNVMGLIQIGHKEILETKIDWIYLNRHASLLDTSISDEGYDTISKDKDYEVVRFTFHTDNDIQKYWDTLYQTCLVTKLGLKGNNKKSLRKQERKIKKKIELPDIPTTDFDDAIKNDKGHLPGDKLGAGGLDSSLYAHVRKNWNNLTSTDKQKIQQKNKVVLRLHRVAYKVTTRDRKVATIKKKSSSILDPSSSKKKTKFSSHAFKKHVPISSKKTTNNNTDGKTKRTRRRSREYDEIDLQALKRMRKIRTTWNDEEDEILLYCRTILTYWQHPLLHRVINSYTIRDILHWSSKISLNKTSVACQRRLVNLIKSPKVRSDVSSWVFELKQSKFINQRFGTNFLRDLRKVYTDDLEYGNALRIYFVHMIYYLRRIIKNGSILGDNQYILLPSTLNQFWKFYRESQPAVKSDDIKYYDPKSIDDIEISTINLIIHSSMCCTKDKTLYNVQLFDIYKTYKEDVLTKAFKEARDNQLIIQFKKRLVSQTSSSTFSLSHKYKLQLLYISIPYSCYDEYYSYITDTYMKLYDKKLHIEFSSINSGGIFYLSDLLIDSKYELDIQLPKKILTIDPQQSCSGESEKILDHFRKMFENAPKIDYSKILENTIMDNDKKDDAANKNESNKNDCMGKQLQVKKNKIKFNFIDDTYSLMYNPYDILTKLHDSYLHFYCGLINLNKICNINFQNIKNEMISNDYDNDDDNENIMLDNCPFSNCILEDKNYLSKIDEVIEENKETINVLARNNDSESDVTCNNENNDNDTDNSKDNSKKIPNEQRILLTTENLLTIFSKFYNIYKSKMKNYDRKDFGKMKSNKITIDMIKLTKDLLEYQLNNNDDSNKDDLSKTYEYEVTLNKEEKIVRMQDVFVVNIPKLRITYTGDGDQVANYGKLKIPSHLYELCNKFNEILEKTKRDAVWSVPNISLDKFEKDLENNSEFSNEEKQFTKNLLQFIKDCPLGATSTILREKFIDENLLTKCMNILRKYNFVMRVGVEQWTFVHKDHIRPWVVHSYHIKRLEKESIDPKANADFKITELVGDRKRKKQSNNVIGPREKKLKLEEAINDNDIDMKLKTPEDIDNSTSSIEDDVVNEIQKPSTSTKYDNDNFGKRKKRTIKPIERYSEDQSNQTNLTNRETIILRPFPWIRVNGSLNRRVFDKWLGSVLLECLSMCGLLVKKLFIRFNYLQPVCILYLLEILQELDCVTLKKFEKKKLTLFSSHEENEEIDATNFSNLDHVFIIVKPHAINNLTLFIGEKKYKTDFI